MRGRNQTMPSIRDMCVSATVKLMPAITAVSGLAVAMAYNPRVARAATADATSSDYAKAFMEDKGMAEGGNGASGKADAALGGMGMQTYGGGDVLPGFENIPQAISNYLLAVIPVLFVIKFAGRAMLSLTHSGDGTLDIPDFFKAADERAQGPSGGAKDGTSWYIMMGKDFLKYFGVAVGVWAIFNAILMALNFIFSLNSAPTATSDGFLDQFGAAGGSSS